jgi:CRISPR-associated protein Cas2
MREAMIFILFDLPVLTKPQRKAYTKFREELLKNGYVAFQKSIYVKLIKNVSTYPEEETKVSQLAPNEGRVSIFTMSVAKFRTIKTLTGIPIDYNLLCDNIIEIIDSED